MPTRFSLNTVMPNPIYRLLTWFVLLLGLVGSGVVSYWMKSDIETRAYQEFIYRCEEIQLKIIARLKAHEQTLLGGAAMFDVSQTVERQEWYVYAKRLRISEHFSGIQGLGFSLLIPPAQLSAHQASIRAEGFPDYKVWPEGEREVYTSIVFLEPFIERNLRAFGYDMYSEPVRRAAMERARDENVAALSGRVMLVQETGENVQAGTLMYVPVYKKGHAIDTIEQRRAALFGWVYSPFRMTDLLNNIVSYQQKDHLTPVHLRVYDGYNTQAEYLLYDNNTEYSNTGNTGRGSIVQLTNDFNGVIWTLQFEQAMGVNNLDYSKVWISLSAGVFISLLLFVLANFYLTMRINAVDIATKLTRELQESESRFRVLADNAPVLIWLAGLDKQCYHFNKVWLDFTGRTLEQEQGNGWAEGVYADDFQRCLDTYVTSFDARLPFKMEYRLRRYDGKYRWLLDNGVPRFADDGTFLGYIGSCIDITERKLMEEELQQQHTLLNNVINSLSHPFYVVNIDDYTITLANQNSGEWIKGYTTCYQLSHRQTVPCDTKEHLCPIKDVKRTGKPQIVEHLHCNKNGEPRVVEVRAYPVFDEAGEVHQIIEYAIDITERKQAQAKIEKSLSLLHATLESSSDAILVVDLNNRWTLYNQKFIDLWHIPDDIITGSDDNAALSYVLDQIEDAESFLNKVRDLYSNPEASSFNLIHFKDGKIVERYSIPQRVNNEVVGRVWSFRDITERARAEQALQKESEKNLALLRNASDGIHILDTEGNIIEISDSFCNMLGYSREEMIGMNVTQWDAYFPADECLRLVKQQFKKPVRILFEALYRCKDGRIIDVEVSSFPLELDGKSVLFSSSRNITERKKLEVQLHNIFLYTRNLIEASLDPMVTISADGKITDVNKATEKVTGYSREQLIHSDFSDYFTDPEQASAGYREVFSKGKVTDYPLVLKHRDGYLTDVLYNATVYKNENGEIAGVFAAARDITKLKQIELERIKQQQQLQNIITGTNAGTWEWNVQTGELILNERWANIIGYDLAELQPISIQTWIEFCHSDDLKRSNDLLNKHFAGEFDYYDCQCRMKHKQGHWVWVLDRGRLISCTDDNKPLFMAGIHIDISEIKQTEAQLRVAATVFESQEGMLITDVNQVILNVNRAFMLITGYSADELIGRTPRMLKSGRHDKVFYDELWQQVNEKGAWQGEIWNRRKNDDVYPEWLTITAVKDDNGIVTNYVATITDITERKAAEEYINRLAFYDPLTQLPNRRLLQERVKHGIVLYHRTGSKMAVLMMDLDKFKAVNDSLGHAAGDELLQQVAKRIKARLREMDMVARLGGDEFVILIDSVTQHEHIARIAESLIHTLSQVFTLSGEHDVYIGASIGIAIYPEHGNSEEAIMDHADMALYHAKSKGRGCFVYFSEALTEKIKEHAIKETRLRHAIEQRELQVFFQPQTDISRDKVVGAEALVLWYQPTHGYFMPNEFLNIAEETGLIMAIGEWLLRETCRLGREWLDEGLPAVTLAVNVSPYQFNHCDMGALVTQILNETGFPAEYLALEITETGLMNKQEQAYTILSQLHKQGVHLVIDDFGKGYSSLAYLKHFPLDMLKIDKSFIEDLPFSSDDCAITSSIIAMAHHLDLKVLAEGVETVSQLQFLRLQGCDQYQSVHSEALPVSEFVKLLTRLRTT
jgi:diguanylate cyclase (GGDEF)-like protein/PAS domain S-box-containing protein